MSEATTPHRTGRYLVSLALAFWALAPAAGAGELTGLAWDGNGSQPTLQVTVSDKPGYEVQSLEGGQRLRLTFPNTTLGAVNELDGQGTVKGVYPYLSDNGSAVNIDVLAATAGNLQVTETPTGYRVAVQAGTAPEGNGKAAAPAPAAPVAAPAAPLVAPLPPVAAAPAPAAPAAAAPVAADDRPVLQEVVYAKLPGNRVQVTLKMSKRPPEPATFTMNNPPRISMDFPGLKIGLPRSSVRIGEGAVVSVGTVEADRRARVVFNLVRSAAFRGVVDGNNYVVTVDAASGPVAGTQAPKTTRFAAQTGAPAKHGLKNIDFRRGPTGDGKVVIQLSDAALGMDIREQAGEIVIDFLDTAVPAELQRRLDVVDFATPIHTIDVFQQGKNTRMVIASKGKYEHLAYQAGDVFTVNVKPIIEKAGDRPKDEFGYSGEKLSLNFQNIEVKAALQVIADFTGLNFVTSDSVKGSLTLRLKDVPWDQALDIIVQTKGLAMKRSGNVVTVGPQEEMAAKDKASLEATKQVLELEPLISELIQINYAKAEEVAKLLKSVKPVESAGLQSAASGLGGGVRVEKMETESNSLLSPRGQVTVDVRSNSILIQDTPGKVREVRKLIAQLDQPVRQVMIETRLVEATDDFSKNIGAKLGVVRQDTRGLNQITSCGTLNCNVDILNGDPVKLADNALSVNLGANGLNNNPAGSIAASILHLPNSNLLNLELSALESKGQGKVISSPRLITANQKKARIEQGQERVFLTSSLGGSGSVTKKAVLALEVTPQITPDDRVILDVLVTKDSFQDAQTGVINKKEITTQVLLDNGETVVIGGIYEQVEQKSVTKIPFLGDMPLVGALFRKKSEFDNKTELLIFLTPRIMTEALSLR